MGLSTAPMCIGVFDEIRTYSRNGKIKNNDVFLLCCDGVHNHISPEKMTKIIKNKKIPFEKKSEVMRNSIKQGTANDNVSSIIAKYRFSQRKKYLTIIAVALVLITMVIVFGKHMLLHWTLSQLGKITNDIVFTCSCGEQFGSSMISPLHR